MKVLPVEELGVDISDPQVLASLGDEYFESRIISRQLKYIKRHWKSTPMI
jgi:hypothetical protein